MIAGLFGVLFLILSNLGWILTFVLAFAALSLFGDVRRYVQWCNDNQQHGLPRAGRAPRSRRMDDDGVG